MNMLRASFAKQVSDGQYGHERAEVTVEIDEPNVDADQLLFELRTSVHAELSRSPSEAVRSALNAPPRTPRRDPSATVPEDEQDLESLPF